MTPAEALQRIEDCLNGRVHWEGVGPRPWWEALEVVKTQMNGATDALQKCADDADASQAALYWAQEHGVRGIQ